jgi:hypothetical protein
MAVSGTALAALIGGAGVGPAAAQPDKDVPSATESTGGATPELTALMNTQNGLHEVADRIEAVPTGASSGVSNIVVDAEHNALRLYWKGAQPSGVVAEIAAAAKKGITVTTIPAPYRADELSAEVERLAGTYLKNGRITSVAPKADGSGLEVGASAAAVRGGVKAAIASSMPVDLVEQPEAVTSLGRYDDAAPFWGGGYMDRYIIGVGYVMCTNGFAVTGNNAASDYLITAAHCGEGTWSTGLANVIGSTIPTRDVSRDAELIQTSAAAGVYSGGSIIGDAPQSSRAVVGASVNRTGDLVCTSGSFSGEICDIRVVGTGQSVNFDGFGVVRDLVRAESQVNQAVGGNGDSGGPVFSLSGVTAVARGTITGMPLGSDERPCKGVPGGAAGDPEARHCSRVTWYPDIIAQFTSLGVHIKVA